MKWIASELCYYLGLLSTVFIIPALTLSLCTMSLVDRADPNYGYLLVAWICSLLLFLLGVALKNRCYADRER